MVSKGIKRKRNDTVKRKKQGATKCLDISTEKKFNGYLTRSKRSRLASIEVTVKVPLTRNFVHLFIFVFKRAANLIAALSSTPA